jgi:3-oxoacyl-[acyl-carrier protein] reductase
MIVVVTGASRGIGAACAARFVGEKVAVCATRAVPGDFAVSSACDVARSTEVRAFAEEVLTKLGPPDVLINNAGVVVRKTLDDLSEQEWDQVVDVNLKGTFNVTRAFLPAMKARRSGRIINISSISGHIGTARLTAYCAAKHGVVGLTRALAEELREFAIQVNAVCPGSVDTDMLKGSGFAPQMSPAQVASVVYYLAKEAPSAMTGACVDVFG